MEKAVREDLASIAKEDAPHGLMFNTLKAAAMALAKEIDNIESTSKAPLVKQLVDVMSKLTGKEADDDPLGFLAGLADEFPTPADRDDPES
mgnify:FL=1